MIAWTSRAHANDDVLDDGGVLDRVVEEVHQDLLDRCRVGEGVTGAAPRPRRRTVVRQALLERRHRLARQRVEIDVLELESPLLLEPRELEDALDQGRQPRRLVADDAEILRQLLGERARSIDKVSVAALSSESGVLSWCDTCETKSDCIRASSAARPLAITVSPRATSIRTTDKTVGQYPPAGPRMPRSTGALTSTRS